jgi:hypothetical protein
LNDQPASLTSLLSSVAAILNAVVWPGVAVWFLFLHRAGISHLLKVFGDKLSSAKKVKFGQLELEDALAEGVSDAREQITDSNMPKSITNNQIQAAQSLKEKVNTTELPESQVLEAVKRQIFDLASEYESVRSQVPSGYSRTRKMNEIAAGMRTLALAGLPLRNQLSRSDSVGKRLAAICMIQVEPHPKFFRWLIERVKTESQPFIFYQAAVAVLELAKKGFYGTAEEARNEITDAIKTISSFSGGEPDQNTLSVLNEALSLVK